MQRNTFERSRSGLRIECGTAYNWGPQSGGPRILGEGLPCKLIYRTKGSLFPALLNAKRLCGDLASGSSQIGHREVSQIKLHYEIAVVETDLSNGAIMAD